MTAPNAAQGRREGKRQIYREGTSGNRVGVDDGIPRRIAEERFDVSRTHYYDLGKKADCALENLCASEQTTERVVVLNKAFCERPVAPPACRGMSAANITAIAEEIFVCSISPAGRYGIFLEGVFIK